jgi:uncharacterized tellurite resistance protein B-like protein
MFIDKLDAKQQGALLGLAAQLIAADGNIAKEESILLNVLRTQMFDGVTPYQASINDLPRIFQSTSARVALLLELIGIAHADAEYHITEKDIISRIAISLKVSGTKMADMESWVCRQFALMREANQFMED